MATQAERLAIIKLTVAMFNAAPGSVYLSELVSFFDASAGTAEAKLQSLARALSETGAYKAINPTFQTAAEFASVFLTPFNLQGNAEAVAFITSRFATTNKGQIAAEAAIAIANSTSDAFAEARNILVNKGLVAEYFSVTKAVAQTSVSSLQSVISSVTAVASSVDTAKTAIDNGAGATTGSIFTLTTAVDTIAGGAANETINATNLTLNSFDNINGGAGTDTFNYADSSAAAFGLPASVTFAGLESIIVSRTSTAVNTGAVAITNTTFGTGVTSLNYSDASIAANMTAATVSVTLNTATAVTVAATGTGTFDTVAITDTSTTVGSVGNTLATVTVTKAGGAATLTGNSIATVNINAVAGLTTVTAAAATRALTVNAAGTTTQGGLTDAQATTATLNVTGAQTFGTLTVAKAGTVTINTNAAATTTVVAAAATTLNLGGTGLNTLTAAGTNAALTSVVLTGAGGVAVDLSGITTLTSIDATASTAAAPASGVLTGANTLTIGTGTAVTGGAGQEVITVGATTKAISLGAGNDTAVVNATALGTGGSITGGDGIDTLKLSNADAVTLSTAGAVQTAFRAAVTGFETLDITTQSASTVNVAGPGTFSTIKMVSATNAQILSGVTSGQTIELVFGAAGTSVTTNSLTAPADVLTIKLGGNLSAANQAFGAFVTPGVETVNIVMADTNAVFTTRLADATVTDANATSIVITGNNGLALVHTGTALSTLNAGGLTKGALTFTSAALTTDATVTGSLTGGDTLNFGAAVSKITMTATAGINTLTGSSTIANTITGGSGADTITGGSGVDVLSGGAGADIITGGLGLDTMTGGLGIDTFSFVATAGTTNNPVAGNFDTITDFVAATDLLQFTTVTDIVSAQQAAVQTAVTALAASSTAAQIVTAMALANTTSLGVAFAVYAGDTYVLFETTGGNTTFTVADDIFIKLTGVTVLPTFANSVTA